MTPTLARAVAPIACAALGLVAAGCASAGSQHGTAALQANPAKAVVASPIAVKPVAAATIAPAQASAPGAIASDSMPTDTVPPHFGTPDAAMRYLVAAYNANNETNLRHVTTPDSRDQFETERQWVKSFRFRDCTSNGAPAWDYTCVLDIVTTMPGIQAATDPTGNEIMDEVTVLVAAAARPGYYLEANEGCGGG